VTTDSGNTSSQVKSMMLTDAGSKSLCIRIILETLLKLFKNSHCHTPIDPGTGRVDSVIIFNTLGHPKIVWSRLKSTDSTSCHQLA